MATLTFLSILAFLILSSSSSSSSISQSEEQQTPSYLQFVLNATQFPAKESYDYIIVGGGTAGCPLAATLSKCFNVLLLERGGIPYGRPDLMNQEGFLTSLIDVDSLSSPTEAFISEDGVPNARGRVLGGSSAINAGFYSRADQEFYKKSGIKWNYRLVNQSYKWVEKEIVFKPQLKNWQSAIRDALIESGVRPYNGFSLNHIPGTKIGGSTFDGAGNRRSAADLLSYSNGSNIKVAIHAYVERILLTGDSSSSPTAAIGVIYRDEIGGYHRAMVTGKGEVILAAGALGSPQLLLLSGIGPRPYLSSMGIPVTVHSPSVGQYLYDNPRNGISFVPPFPLEHSLIQVVGITDSGAYIEAASNIIPFSTVPMYFTVATLMEKIIGPNSVGSLRLASTDVRTNPLVRFNYLSHPIDLARCINGTRKIGEVLKSSAMEGFKFDEVYGRRDFRYVGPSLPENLTSDREMGQFCRRTVGTIWHYHGGCVVKKVVDRNLKVIQVQSLRVVDGSVFSVSPGTNPQATLMMMGR
ncbi:(R)-mandelonitrile lyase-like [Impatiens glandulifera]|uniref:(R)-mandelonitrile lyase-like n=1 Tax=Impatiens glandulifera TaxID=253017 RepID=UPI001FB169A8|nr:(R)-mandelonitrile lyase-like [Impatiens glandulifera]